MQDPKNPRPRRTTPRPLPTLRGSVPPPLPPTAPDAPLQGPSVQAGIPTGPTHEVEVRLPDCAQLLEAVAGHDDDGYYKLCPGNDGKSWYLSYRWRWGTWGGHYVMAVVQRGDLRYGLTLLAEKVHAVRSGSLRPTRDRYGD